MLFNSLSFAIFLPVVFFLYWYLRHSLYGQNTLLLIASYLFYGWWDARFLSLIIASTIVDFILGLSIANSNSIKRKKIYLITSIVFNLGLLGIFKYYNFFLENFLELTASLGIHTSLKVLSIVLPVGISFYTFQTMSYTIDIYRRKLNPTNDFVGFATFVGYFPQLVAGPIERASNLLPQIIKPRSFDYNQSVDGLRQALWGFFKKVVIADVAAPLVDQTFANPQSYNASALIIGAILFSVQIYCDFSGYSDIAIGISKLFGIELMQNFRTPYFSRDIAEFWRRWHISLSTWFRDYLYIPLGGSQGSIILKVRNTFLIFIISGFWHGANWTFIMWGLINALLFLPLLLTNSNRNNIDHANFKDIQRIAITFIITTIAWVFFRVDSLDQAMKYFNGILMNLGDGTLKVKTSLIACIALLFLGDWIGRKHDFTLNLLRTGIFKQYTFLRFAIYICLAYLIILNIGSQQNFIYFQF